VTATLMHDTTGIDFASRYATGGLIARGGTSYVHEAMDAHSGEVVATKSLLPELTDEVMWAGRLRCEALIMAHLRHHPNVVHLIAYDDRRSRIVMERIEGKPLSDLLGASWTFDQIITIGRQACSALEAVARLGIVHRDVKPGNLIFGRDGRIRLIDFTISSPCGELQLIPDLDQTGTIPGTSAYFSPEQAQGYRVTSASDVFSLGMVLYQLLAMQPPFMVDANSEPNTLSAIIKDPPIPLSDLRPEAAAFEPLMAWMLNKELDQRPSVAQVSQALHAIAA
jgi:serine/threonine protein kinase